MSKSAILISCFILICAACSHSGSLESGDGTSPLYKDSQSSEEIEPILSMGLIANATIHFYVEEKRIPKDISELVNSSWSKSRNLDEFINDNIEVLFNDHGEGNLSIYVLDDRGAGDAVKFSVNVTIPHQILSTDNRMGQSESADENR